MTCNLRFPGQYYDQETGLHYNGFRDYDPSTGRYVQSDPIGLAGGDTYGYVAADPLNRIDRHGLFDIFVFSSLTGDVPGPIPVRPAVEAVGVFGYESPTGLYEADIVARGFEFGGRVNYFGYLIGGETTASCAVPKNKISLKEISIGLGIPYFVGYGVGGGRYSTALESGYFFFLGEGAVGEYGAIGFGFSTWTSVVANGR